MYNMFSNNQNNIHSLMPQSMWGSRATKNYSLYDPLTIIFVDPLTSTSKTFHLHLHSQRTIMNDDTLNILLANDDQPTLYTPFPSEYLLLSANAPNSTAQVHGIPSSDWAFFMSSLINGGIAVFSFLLFILVRNVKLLKPFYQPKTEQLKQDELTKEQNSRSWIKWSLGFDKADELIEKEGKSLTPPC